MPDKVSTIYTGSYEILENIDPDESIRLRGNGTTIGTRLAIEFPSDEKGPIAQVVSRVGVLGTLPNGTAGRVRALAEQGWICFAALSLIWYNRHAEVHYHAEVAVIAYNPVEEEIFSVYTAGLLNRIANGQHPEVELSAKGLERVRESKGTWCETKKVALPKFERESGEVVYQQKQSFSDSLTEAAAEGKTGVKVLAVFFYVAVFLIIAALVWHFAF
jgi:hypothetical protein